MVQGEITNMGPSGPSSSSSSAAATAVVNGVINGHIQNHSQHHNTNNNVHHQQQQQQQQHTPTPAAAKMYENLNGGAGDSNAEKKKKVGNYIISKTIGEGSFAKVRLGYHLITQQMVAVKVINKREVLKRNYLRANLRREASMMQRMQHPHIVQLYEVMETENCYYIVMELIDGIEFVKYLSKKRSLDENETRDYIRQICSAVDHMHKAKVIHRDIKLQNFMLDQSHNLTIIDFGLSNSLDDREFLNTQCGSPAYAAPEIFAHQDYGPEVDVWSIGVNMYAMLAGKLPFKVENRSKNLAKLHACILKGFEIPPFLSPDCQDLLCRLLDPSPAKRIKMSEIFAHPWINYNCLPIEIIPYKPAVDIKEIRPEIVQYLVNKHDYTENDIIDAIVYRKPIALKAVYYLIEKRLKQGLQFPDPDFNGLLALDAATNGHHHNNQHYSLTRTKSRHLGSSNANENHHYHHPQSGGSGVHINGTIENIARGAAAASSHHHHPTHTTIMSQHQNSASTTATNGTGIEHHHRANNNNGGLVKQNSQLLPKRQPMSGAHLATRSSSQKNVDYKSVLTNLNNTSANVNYRMSFSQVNNNGGGGVGAAATSNGHSSYKENQQHGNNNHHDNNSVGDSNSPSPDFIAAAMSPIKVTNGHHHHHHHNTIGSSTTSLSRNSRQTNYQDLVNRTTTRQNSSVGSTNNNASINNLTNIFNGPTNNNNNKMYTGNSDYNLNGGTNGRASTISYTNEHRYYLPVAINSGAANPLGNTANGVLNGAADDNGSVLSAQQQQQQQPQHPQSTQQQQQQQSSTYQYKQHGNGVVAAAGSAAATAATAGTIRSLPPSVYRGSPERSLPSRSPDRMISAAANGEFNGVAVTRPGSRVSSSRPSVVSSADVGYDVASIVSGSRDPHQKYKVINYLATTKRSMTSCDDAAFVEAKQKALAAAAAAATLSNKNRQLTMGKAKIDLDTQPNLNVGMSAKSMGTYLKSSLSKGGAENLKSFNSLNIKPSMQAAYKQLSSNSPSPSNHTNGTNGNESHGSRGRHSSTTTLVHRHSNPAGSLVNLVGSSPSPSSSSNLKQRLQSATAVSTPITAADSPANALPRIKINT